MAASSVLIMSVVVLGTFAPSPSPKLLLTFGVPLIMAAGGVFLGRSRQTSKLGGVFAAFAVFYLFSWLFTRRPLDLDYCRPSFGR
jgi:hypothetical protein